MSPVRTAALCLSLAATVAALPVNAQDTPPANLQIDYSGFVELAARIGEYREGRRIAWRDFAVGARADDAVLLDTRSPEAFAAGHLRGAVNLPFADFTEAKLSEVLGPNKGRPVYIYCNNNFADDAPPVARKKAELALNIPTFINLYGYGYENVWELADIVLTAELGPDWVAATRN